jgi:hypothetical protein
LLFAVFAFAFRVLCAGSTLAGHDDFRSLLAVLATGWDGKAQQLFGWLVLYGLISYELGVHRHYPPFSPSILLVFPSFSFTCYLLGQQ